MCSQPQVGWSQSVNYEEFESDGFVIIQRGQSSPETSAKLKFENEIHSTSYDGDTESNSSSPLSSLAYFASEDSETSVTSTSTISLLTGIDMEHGKGTRDPMLNAHEWWVSDEYYYENERV